VIARVLPAVLLSLIFALPAAAQDTGELTTDHESGEAARSEYFAEQEEHRWRRRSLAFLAAAQDTGELTTQEELLTLGPDVEAAVGPPALAAPSPDRIEAITGDVASKLRCPVCQGMTVADSTTEFARNMKHQVRALVAAGYDEGQILTYFESSYGEFIRLLPTTRGFNLLVWILPLAMIGVGFLFVAGYIRSMRGTGVPSVPAAPDHPEDPWIAQVRRELADG
jgi:cytochrome c-type biogenesis protein CcmH